MHSNEFNINSNIVQELIDQQFPEFSKLSITQVNSTGTVNAIFRLGNEFYIRLPRAINWANDILKEWKWLPRLAPYLSLSIPVPVKLGRPNTLYPFYWAIYKWIDGDNYTDELINDEHEAARELAKFVAELHSIEIRKDAPEAGRLPLLDLNKITIDAINASSDLIDRDNAILAWKHSLKTPIWKGHKVWIHADLLRPNLLVKAGRLSAIIDFGSAGIGDPAFDIIPAWSVFNSEGRKTFGSSVNVDNDTWIRARGYALHQAALIIPYYRITNPKLVILARKIIDEILFDLRVGAT
jgi:aminoglycoside phosphotransferase (APT) family kinase protein